MSQNTHFVCYFWAKIVTCAILHAVSISGRSTLAQIGTWKKESLASLDNPPSAQLGKNLWEPRRPLKLTCFLPSGPTAAGECFCCRVNVTKTIPILFYKLWKVKYAALVILAMFATFLLLFYQLLLTRNPLCWMLCSLWIITGLATIASWDFQTWVVGGLGSTRLESGLGSTH